MLRSRSEEPPSSFQLAKRRLIKPCMRDRLCDGPKPLIGVIPKPTKFSHLLVPFEVLRTGRQLEARSTTSNFYRLGVPLAQGAAGDVFAAVSVSKGSYTQVAAKRMRVAKYSQRRLALNEIQASFLCRDGHPNIVRTLDWFPGLDGIDREIYLIMERCDFGLDDFIHAVREARISYEKYQRQRKLSMSLFNHRFAEAEIGKILTEMTAALCFLNNHGIVHQDVKTENILWKHTDDRDGVYKMCDFGVIGFGQGKRLAQSQTNQGTLWTQAPEILRGLRHDASCDIWSLGCVVYEACFYDKPFNSILLMSYRNDREASLTDPFPPASPVRNESPQRRRISNHRSSPFLPYCAGVGSHQKWIYSDALKALIMCCFNMRSLSRYTAAEMLISDEYLGACKEFRSSDCKAKVSSSDFYQVLLQRYRDVTSDNPNPPPLELNLCV